MKNEDTFASLDILSFENLIGQIMIYWCLFYDITWVVNFTTYTIIKSHQFSDSENNKIYVLFIF